MKQSFFFVPALLATLVSACATLPKPVQPPAAIYAQHLDTIRNIGNFAMSGRMAVLTENKGFSGSMRWHHHEEGDDIQFYSPLGGQLGSLNKNNEGVTLTTSNQKTVHASDAESLTQQTLGWSLPLTGLSDWMLGRPTDGEVEVLAWDISGNITHMRQNGWDIEYPAYQMADEKSLPGKIILKNPKLEFKLVVEHWQTGDN